MSTMRKPSAALRGALILLAVVVCLALPLPPDVAAQVFVSTDKPQYVMDDNVVVSFNGMSGSPTDWISLAVSGSGVTSFVTWQYTGGALSGSLTFVAPTPGTYVARAYFNNSYTLQAESAPFSVEVPSGQGSYGLTLTASTVLVAPPDPVTGLPLEGNPPAIVTLTASVTRSVPWPYDIFIFDKTLGTTGPNLRQCNHYNSCSIGLPHYYIALINGSIPTAAPRQFIAYVAKYSDHLPANTPLDTSDTVEVSLQEFQFEPYLLGLTLNGDSLRATVNQPTFGTGVSINIYNLTTQKLVRSCSDMLGFDTCSAYIGPPSGEPQPYIAYVSRYSPTNAPPDIRATSNIVVR